MYKIIIKLAFVVTIFFCALNADIILAQNVKFDSEITSYLHSGTGVLFPQKLGEFEFSGKVKDYEEESPGAGIGLEYNSQNGRISIFLYTQGLLNIPSGTQSPLIKKHFQFLLYPLFDMEKRGLYSDFRMLIQEEEARIGTVSFLHAKFSSVQKGAPNISHIYLTGYKSHFLKIRITHRDIEHDEKIVSDFLKELGRQL